MNRLGEITFLCAKTIILFDVCRCMSEKKENRRKQIKWLSNEIAKKVSEKSSVIYMYDYLSSYKLIENFICYCLGELVIKKTDAEIIKTSEIILKYRFLNIPLTDAKYHINQIAMNSSGGKKSKFTRSEISDFLAHFICETLFI